MSNPSETLPAPGVIREAIDLGRFPWIRPLVGAYAHDFASVAPLFAGNPADPQAWRDTIARVQRAPRDRARLASVVSAQLDRRQAPPEARAAAAALADARSVAIVTGQQAGLGGGPLYTLLKAVTALQLARRVSDGHGLPVVPIFWVDAEDHDWAEVRAAKILDASFELKTIALADVPGAGRLPMGSLVLDDGVETMIDELDASLAPTEFTAGLVAMLRRAYVAGATMSGAFASLIDRLLGRHGMVVFESSDPAAKPIVADLFAREIANPSRTATLAREGAAAMSALGHAPQVEPAEDAVALFYLDAGGRHAIKRSDAQFQIGDVSKPAAELRAEAETHPERFSPNVLLRPLVQDRLFPTICYVAGPSELAYQAQLKAIYAEFQVEPPLLYPRANATLLDSAAIRFLDKHALPIETFQAPDESALNRWLERQLPPSIEQTIADTSRQIRERIATIRETVAGVDPTLGGAVDTTLDKMLESLKTLQNKIVQASKKKDDTLRRQFLRTQRLTFPNGIPQERELSLVFFANRYGDALIDRLIDGLPLETGKHYVVNI
ncbi:MAG TPA: bacillithiol biosynthesis cysteine-adding enzyme BshC [Vicinamibacterales bacterium]|nr:bacillithiol biosynthesis cysteine-adding enzyme BshC [Vicinamibacterales bacterium]